MVVTDAGAFLLSNVVFCEFFSWITLLTESPFTTTGAPAAAIQTYCYGAKTSGRSPFASVFQLGFSSQQQVRYPCIALLSCIVLQNDAAREVLSHRCDRARVRAGAARADASEVTWRI